MPQRLSKVELDEVSLVDKPAAQGAKVILMKRDKSKDTSEGIQFNIGFTEDGDSDVQSVVFSKESWTSERAVEWLKAHDMVSSKLDETENTLRYRQKDPKGFARFRMISPGDNVSKALRAKQSLSQLQSAISSAVQNEFGDRSEKGSNDIRMYAWVRDLFKDSVIYECDGNLFRVAYTVVVNKDGIEIAFEGEPVAVEVAYVDVKKKGGDVATNTDEISAEMLARVLEVGARAQALIEKINPFVNNQPRKPAGGKDGGQFESTGGPGSLSGGGSGGGSGKPSPRKVSPSSVRVETNDYYNTHLKQPSGRGNWAFKVGSETWMPGTLLLYAEAKKQAKAYAASKGVTTVMALG